MFVIRGSARLLYLPSLSRARSSRKRNLSQARRLEVRLEDCDRPLSLQVGRPIQPEIPQPSSYFREVPHLHPARVRDARMHDYKIWKDATNTWPLASFRNSV